MKSKKVSVKQLSEDMIAVPHHLLKEIVFDLRMHGWEYGSLDSSADDLNQYFPYAFERDSSMSNVPDPTEVEEPPYEIVEAKNYSI